MKPSSLKQKKKPIAILRRVDLEFFNILTFHASAPLDEKRMMLFNMHN